MDEEKNKLVDFIIENCPHYYDTLEYVCDGDDIVSDALIDFYRNSIDRININNKAHTRFISELDNLMYLYITDSNINDIIKSLMLSDELFVNNLKITDSLFIKIRHTVKYYMETNFKRVESPIWI